jgi:hypothetical protein
MKNGISFLLFVTDKNLQFKLQREDQQLVVNVFNNLINEKYFVQKGWKNKRRSGSKEIPKKITPKSKI